MSDSEPGLGQILLVEDSPTDAELTLRALRKHGLADQVLWVKDGAQALDCLFHAGDYAGLPAASMPRLVLLDLKLPKVDGIEVLRRIKADERTRSLPVVMLTSSAEERDVLASYSLGVNSYIVKPVDFQKFLDTVSDVGLYWMLTNHPPY